METDITTLDPLTDYRWKEFLTLHPRASVFHSPEWLRALQKTYGYEPIVISTEKKGSLRQGLVLCDVKSWLTGRRALSLPFSDHCEPLVDSEDAASTITRWLLHEADARGWKYVELRLVNEDSPFAIGCDGALGTVESLVLHKLNLRPTRQEIYKRFHKTCIQRKIERARNEKVRVEIGQSDKLLKAFYRLMILTRRRFHLLPQPYSWFVNLRESFGQSLALRIAYKDNVAIAAIMTLIYGRTVVYKYGCSDATYHRCGAMPLLMWDTVCDAKDTNAEWLDLGRSDRDAVGLIAFKDRLGAEKGRLSYLRYPAVGHPVRRVPMIWRSAIAKLPDFCLAFAGSLAYRHAA